VTYANTIRPTPAPNVAPAGLRRNYVQVQPRHLLERLEAIAAITLTFMASTMFTDSRGSRPIIQVNSNTTPTTTQYRDTSKYPVEHRNSVYQAILKTAAIGAVCPAH